MASGVVEALLYAIAHDASCGGTSIAASAVASAANLIGRNEKGLTLSQEAIGHVLGAFHTLFDPSNRYCTYCATRCLGRATAVAGISIADSNKPFIISHGGSIDDLISGLLLDGGVARRQQQGAEKLQETCALALQNLALSEISRAPLQAHSGVMAALRRLSSSVDSAALSEKARQCASASLFELDEQARSAATVTTTAVATEHIMLSYNWDHQATIKRVNASLQSRGHAVWIDIEKMQGSTVEAMADAVEGAAVMCYGISRAYKESAKCRLEAQYAYQRQKEMVPLMVEEGYRADGWLGMLLGTRLWYSFCGAVLLTEGAFEGKVEELCRELGPLDASSTVGVDSVLARQEHLDLDAALKDALDAFDD